MVNPGSDAAASDAADARRGENSQQPRLKLGERAATGGNLLQVLREVEIGKIRLQQAVAVKPDAGHIEQGGGKDVFFLQGDVLAAGLKNAGKVHSGIIDVGIIKGVTAKHRVGIRKVVIQLDDEVVLPRNPSPG